MKNDELARYRGLAKRWLDKSEPFDGICYRCTSCEEGRIRESLDRVLRAFEGSGLCSDAVLGVDYFVESDDFYAESFAPVDQVAAYLARAFGENSPCEGVYGCYLCVLAANCEVPR